jgi:hypothetical protein
MIVRRGDDLLSLMSCGESDCSWRILQTRRTPIFSGAETSHTDSGIYFHPLPK